MHSGSRCASRRARRWARRDSSISSAKRISAADSTTKACTSSRGTCEAALRRTSRCHWASICFEQSYSGVDGDSASSTEIYALLSALSELPLRQDIAVTGSMNQRGDIQAIGGVNEKIEGFFDTCRIEGLTGTQGVMIPAANVEDLMLREDVLEAVKGGKFHIWPIGRVEQGVELLTGTRAGQRDGDGGFEKGTVFAQVDQRLREMAKTMKEFE